MAQVTYVPDRVAPPLDGKLEELAGQAVLAGRPLRLRLQPDIYNVDKRVYDSWTGVTWTIDLDDVAEGKRLRETLGKVLVLFGKPEQQAGLVAALDAMMAEEQ